MANDQALITNDHKFSKLVQQEDFILEVTEALVEALRQSGMNQSDLAKRLGCTRGFVSQLINGGRNLTLRTVADVAHAIGVQPKFSVCPERDQHLIATTHKWPTRHSPRIVLDASGYSHHQSGKQMVA